MNLEQAKQVILDALVENFVDDDLSNEFKRRIARTGFTGYAQLTLRAQVDLVYELELQESDDELAAACEKAEACMSDEPELVVRREAEALVDKLRAMVGIHPSHYEALARALNS